MNIALIGYGKMGKIIEEIALSRGHAIVLKVSGANASTYTDAELKAADVAIEFSRPDGVLSNINRCVKAGVPVVVGTTGWYDHLPGVTEDVRAHDATLFHASNFSIGVNLFFRLNEKLAELMKPFPQYEPMIEEIHHVHKLDAPSGTALTLAHGIMNNLGRKKEWKLYHDTSTAERTIFYTAAENELPIMSVRTGEVPGTHKIEYSSDVDRIVITHEAFNRTGFATGAVIAAEWVATKKGVFTMHDLLGE